MVQVNRVCLKILFINRPQFLVDSNDLGSILSPNEIKDRTNKQDDNSQYTQIG
jgi:hypothetical protein